MTWPPRSRAIFSRRLEVRKVFAALAECHDQDLLAGQVDCPQERVGRRSGVPNPDGCHDHDGLVACNVVVGADEAGGPSEQRSDGCRKQVRPCVCVDQLAQGPPDAARQCGCHGLRRSASAVVHDQCGHRAPFLARCVESLPRALRISHDYRTVPAVHKKPRQQVERMLPSWGSRV